MIQVGHGEVPVGYPGREITEAVENVELELKRAILAEGRVGREGSSVYKW